MPCKFRIEKRRDKITGEIRKHNVPIYADINIKQKRINYTTGYRIDADRWTDIKLKDERTGAIIYKQEVEKNAYGMRGDEKVKYNIINRDLEIIRATIHTIEKTIPLDKITSAYIASKLDEAIGKFANHSYEEVDTSFWALFDRFVKCQQESNKAKKGRVKSYINTQTNLLNFEKYVLKHKIEFADMDGKMMEDFDRFMLTDDNINGRYNHLPIKNRPRPKGHNTRVRIMGVLRTYLRWVQNEYNIATKAFKEYKIPMEIYEDPYFLTAEERDLLMSHNFSSDTLNLAKDIFTIHAFLGARVGDYYELTKDNIITDGDKSYIEFIADKTIENNPRTIRIPMRQEVKDIIEKYGYPQGRLFPHITRQDYNERLRQMIFECGITRKVSILNKITMQEEKKYLWEVFSSHNVRKTFIAAMKRKNIPNSTIASMSGHQPNSKAFSRYYSVSDDQKEEALNSI